MAKKAQSGVTLLEAMIVIAIVGILVAIAFPAYQTQIANAQLKVKAESALNGLQFARSEALRRNTRVFFTVSSDSSWTVGCETTVADLNGDGTADCPASIQTKSSQEGSGNISITFTPTASRTATFTGLSLLSTTNKDSSVPFTQINFSNSGTSKSYRITLTPGGQSKICDPTVITAGDTLLC